MTPAKRALLDALLAERFPHADALALEARPVQPPPGEVEDLSARIVHARASARLDLRRTA